MKAPIPVLEKTPYALDPTPLEGSHTSRAGAAISTRLFRSFKLPGACEANLPQGRKTKKDYSSGQFIETICTGTLLGIDRLEDLDALREDDGLTRLTGYTAPSARATRDFLETFHQQDLIDSAKATAEEAGLLAYIPRNSTRLEGLHRILGASARQSALAGESGIRHATVDADATIVESGKRNATYAYTGVKGYQPAVAVWAEADVILATEFRDGNVPARYQPLNVVKTAFAALPGSVQSFAFRGDSACYESDLLDWLTDEQRAGGPKGRIEFAVSAVMSEALVRSCRSLPEQAWSTLDTEADGTLRQWAELPFVPSERYEHKESKPLRYVGLRLVKAQGELFDNGTRYRHLAICTNRTMGAPKLIEWHRQKAGTIEHVHDELKNSLAAAAMPSQKFGANAAWFSINCIAYNLASAIRAAVADDNLRTARIKRLRFALFSMSGRIVRDRRKIRLRFATSVRTVELIAKLFDCFPLRTVSTG
jgi:hypothetical protein